MNSLTLLSSTSSAASRISFSSCVSSPLPSCPSKIFLTLPTTRVTTSVKSQAQLDSSSQDGGLSASPSPSSPPSLDLLRRQFVIAAAALASSAPFLSSCSSPALAATVPKGFSATQDSVDRYAFFYPFGWQEVAVAGQDIVFKDVIEPLENVSVNIIKTEKTDLSQIGTAEEVAQALVINVLTPPSQKSKILAAKERVVDGKKYYQFEFAIEAPNYIRHALGAVAIGNGRFYTITTGSNQRRWNKVQEKLRVIVDSFTVL